MSKNRILTTGFNIERRPGKNSMYSQIKIYALIYINIRLIILKYKWQGWFGLLDCCNSCRHDPTLRSDRPPVSSCPPGNTARRRRAIISRISNTLSKSKWMLWCFWSYSILTRVRNFNSYNFNSLYLWLIAQLLLLKDVVRSSGSVLQNSQTTILRPGVGGIF